jgi:hypothetical protein
MTWSRCVRTICLAPFSRSNVLVRFFDQADSAVRRPVKKLRKLTAFIAVRYIGYEVERLTRRVESPLQEVVVVRRHDELVGLQILAASQNAGSIRKQLVEGSRRIIRVKYLPQLLVERAETGNERGILRDAQ